MAFAVRFPPPKGRVLILMLLSIHKDIFKIIIFQFYPYKNHITVNIRRAAPPEKKILWRGHFSICFQAARIFRGRPALEVGGRFLARIDTQCHGGGSFCLRALQRRLLLEKCWDFVSYRVANGRLLSDGFGIQI